MIVADFTLVPKDSTRTSSLLSLRARIELLLLEDAELYYRLIANLLLRYVGDVVVMVGCYWVVYLKAGEFLCVPLLLNRSASELALPRGR